MKKAILVDFSFVTRIVIDEIEENFEAIVERSRNSILEKVKNELGDNIEGWRYDEEMPYNESEDSQDCPRFQN